MGSWNPGEERLGAKGSRVLFVLAFMVHAGKGQGGKTGRYLGSAQGGFIIVCHTPHHASNTMRHSTPPHTHYFLTQSTYCQNAVLLCVLRRYWTSFEGEEAEVQADVADQVLDELLEETAQLLVGLEQRLALQQQANQGLKEQPQWL